MTTAKFLGEPWKNSHGAFAGAVFSVRPAPEFATAEVIVASLYRSAGFQGYTEKVVTPAGRKFDRASAQGTRKGRGAGYVSAETWRTILHGVLDSPKQPNQSSKRFLHLCPIVPDIALYSGSARLAGIPWVPGALVQRIMLLGCEDRAAAERLWARLGEALAVSPSDDIWAQWLQGEFQRRKADEPSWQRTELDASLEAGLPRAEWERVDCPSKQLARDLGSVIDAKTSMTRRQWISLLEAMLRLGCVSHVLWLCDVNGRLWSSIRGILEHGEHAPNTEAVLQGIVSRAETYLVHGKPAVPIIRGYAARYLMARLGINMVLWQLEDLGVHVGTVGSCADVAKLLAMVEQHRTALLGANLMENVFRLRDQEARALDCKKGIGSNLVEFMRHALGQRQTANESLRGYDQGYLLKKRGDYPSAPWIVSLGPVAVLALVHCCLSDAAGPRSVQRFCQHLGAYGVDVDRDDVASSDLGRKLRMLGLVLDSPDAESGMLLVAPFDSNFDATREERP